MGDGYGIVRGKWLESNIELFEKNNIKVDFDNLGFFVPQKQEEIIEKKESSNFFIRKIQRKLEKIKRKRAKKQKEKLIRKSMV